MEYHLLREAENNMRTWFAKVPTEANIADYPSKNMPHDLLEQRLDESAAPAIWFENLVNILELGPARQMGECRQPGPTWQKGIRFACPHVANSWDQTMQLILIIKLSWR